MATNNAINLAGSGIASYDGAGTFSGRTITGTTSFIDLTNGDGIAGNPTIAIGSDFEETGMHGWNGALLETAAVTVTAAGGTITCSVELSGGGNLTAVFSDGYYDWTTAPDTVTLTAGSDTSPTINYVYLLQSDKTLTASTVGWPAAEHAPMCTALCQSAASLQTDGAYKVHVWTDHVIATDDQGHLSDINFWIRQQPSTWASGVSQTYSISGGPPNNVILTTGAGVVLQLHDHTFPAFAGTPDIYVVNDSVTPYTIVTDLNSITADSTGASLVGKYYSLVIWGCVSEDTGDCKLFCNLPNGSYNNSTGVEDDADNFAVYTVPPDFTGTGFLISEWKLRQQAAGGGTFTSIAEIDLRGLLPSLTAGGGGAANTEFVDNVFRILNVTDSTKEIAFAASSITTATTRTITMVDADLDLATVSNSFPTDGGTAAPTANVLTIAGGTGVNTSGAATTVTINIDSPVIVANGGTGATTLTGVLTGNGAGAVTANAVTEYGVVIAGASNAVTSIAPSATSGVPVISQGAAANPAFGTAVVAGGGTGLTSTTAYAVLCGGTTSTSSLQSIAGVGTAAQVLTSNGAGALPTFQAAAGGSATKEFFAYPVDNDAFTAVGNWVVASLSSSSETHFSFIVPNDFSSLTESVVVIIPDASETIQWDLNVSVSAAGEAYNNDNRQTLNATQAVTVNLLTELDVSGDLTSLSAGDYVTVFFESDTAVIKVLGFRFKYA